MRCGPVCRQKGCGLERGDPDGEETAPADGEKGTTEVLDGGKWSRELRGEEEERSFIVLPGNNSEVITRKAQILEGESGNVTTPLAC